LCGREHYNKAVRSVEAYIIRVLYRAFNERGNGVLNEDRVGRFSATVLPFPARENADVR
jgi:hypothetical protein